MENFYPAFIRLSGRRAVVIGGGPVASRKAATLLAAGASVTIISPSLSPALQRLADEGLVSYENRNYREGDLGGAFIAVAATDDPEVNLMAAGEAERLSILINCANPPDAGNFIVPSSVKKGSLTVAVSTGGISPALSKKLRRDLDLFIGAGYGPFLEFLKEAREHVRDVLQDERQRSEAMEELINSDALMEFRSNPPEVAFPAARERLEAIIKRLKK
ncbi:MAG: bifunctional precorrin-2 dehydrogenase/sirohydrochlorin ferrochelatase [Nitrospirota bacterium]